MKYDIAVVIGRFQPFHNGHKTIISRAMAIAEEVVVVIGSANQPRTVKNPFTASERAQMIDAVFPDQAKLRCVAVEDNLYHETGWIQAVQQAVDAPEGATVAILGYEKDESSYYLRCFPEWEFFDIGGYTIDHGRPIDASKIRELMFDRHVHYANPVVPESVYNTLLTFTSTEEYETLSAEHEYLRMYKQQWQNVPYPVTFFTVDSVVVQSGHILLVQRRAQPGKGLWALPGGFINQDETAMESAVRELREETRIKVPPAVLRGSIKAEKLFDAPGRSQRGRTITQAFLFELPEQEDLPKVKGSDDAMDARWFPLSKVACMTDHLFEDHASIIRMMVNRAK